MVTHIKGRNCKSSVSIFSSKVKCGERMTQKHQIETYLKKLRSREPLTEGTVKSYAQIQQRHL